MSPWRCKGLAPLYADGTFLGYTSEHKNYPKKRRFCPGAKNSRFGASHKTVSDFGDRTASLNRCSGTKPTFRRLIYIVPNSTRGLRRNRNGELVAGIDTSDGWNRFVR